MPTAFVLINTEIGSETDVLKELKKVEGVDEASAVYGVYDIVARVKADTMDRLKGNCNLAHPQTGQSTVHAHNDCCRRESVATQFSFLSFVQNQQV